MTNPSGDEELGAAISDPVLASLFSELRMVADQPAPAIGDELAAILAGATPLSASARRTRSRRLALVALVSTGALTAGVGAAAAADRLPAPLQRVVAKVVNGVTPFEMPKEPAESGDMNGPTMPADDVTSNPDASVTSDDDEERAHTGASEDDSSTGDDADHADADGEGHSDSDDADGEDEDGGDSEDDSDSDDSDSDDDSEDDDSEDDDDGSDGGDDSESDD